MQWVGNERGYLQGKMSTSGAAPESKSVNKAGPCGLSAVTLIELLCVIAIISILASLLLPAVLRAYTRAREFDEEMSGPSIFALIRNESRKYCVGHPRYLFTDKSDFAEKCAFAPKASDWVWSKGEFVPFGYQDPTNKVVLTIHYGRKQREHHEFTRGELSIIPPE